MSRGVLKNSSLRGPFPAIACLVWREREREVGKERGGGSRKGEAVVLGISQNLLYVICNACAVENVYTRTTETSPRSQAGDVFAGHFSLFLFLCVCEGRVKGGSCLQGK